MDCEQNINTKNNLDRWYILMVKTGMEDKLKDFFQQEEMDCFIPKKEVMQKREGKINIVEKALFPGYLFFRSSLEAREFGPMIQKLRKHTSGVIKELKFSGEDTPALSEDEQMFIEGLLNQEEVLKTSTGIIENDKVIILEGPLRGQESKIVHIDRHKRQATLAIELCTRTMNVKVGLEIIKKIINDEH